MFLKRIICFLCFTLFLCFVSGCADLRTKMVVDGMEPFLEKMKIAMNENNDFELVRDSMPAGIIQLEGFLKVSPTNEDLLVRTSEAYNAYAFAFIEDTDKPRAIKLYQKSKQLALRALQWNNSFRIDQSLSHDDFKSALKNFNKRHHVPALFFLCSSWLQVLALNPQTNTLSAEMSQIEAILDRILALDETYYYGGVHALFGSFYGSRSPQMGGHPEMAKYHFDEAFDISNSTYLLWQLLYAKYYAVQIKDKDLFISTLNHIISAPDTISQETIFPNQIAKRKASLLLKNINLYF